ncbi:Soluble lytic murein transglycosylase [Zhongshania aliphaticivorans]|uniref:Soluble lytic murein transglycosylase n=1 Tax=Zhongshania aliphaticivorans TaxID=1470434 RepID=A0A5S9QED6_9GAMM|nr:transglycosylase SLT domain-containing protein [Zhongshania aliphaticivorans]CAA0088267.1 Soluble lytic murein transglycosylase [Zhongshania aliphaticivorans]CAA0116246.1 Soluble lytic murein transglycosylase [Zhongshania aliphaticivorans]CAA0120396.1 Soluble lytic murein transglycosylase [Zhongshania aliphaticivorans]
MKRLITFFIALSTLISQAHADLSLDESRLLYREAITEISRGRLANAEKLIPKLNNYPLLPYLELELIKAQINNVSPQTIDVYLQQYGDTIVGQRLRISWLNKLRRSRDWPRYVHYYKKNSSKTGSCLYAYALRQIGDHAEADAVIAKTWQTPYSLPKECDPPISQWMARLTQTQKENQYIIRAELALKKGQTDMARYLLGKVTGSDQYIELLRKPARLHQIGSNLPPSGLSQEVAVHTLKRLARGDFEKTNTLWHQLEHNLHFTAAQNYALRDSMARQTIASDADYTRDWITATDPNHEDPYLTEWRIRLALKDRDWIAVQKTIPFLPPEKREKADWRYWWARADIELNGELSVSTQLVLQQLAAERGYYSFLAADILNEDYQLASTRTVDASLLEEIKQHSAIIRARELYLLGEHFTATLEWNYGMRSLNTTEKVAAAQLALNWGWSHQSIMTAIRAGEWDDLTLRFPTPYKNTFSEIAKRENIELKWIYAIARQESAFSPSANSSVGARGIMQLMPGTARTVARQMGIAKPRTADLVTPEKNIAMGGFYLGQLQEQFGGNRILATAAYNAGPTRVERVLLRQKGDLPADIWIENLPYGETREYIKNVLAFSVIYADKLKLDRPLLASHERIIGPANAATAQKN